MKTLYKWFVFAIGAMLVIGNHIHSLPISGFDYYVVGMPFGFKSVVSFVAIMAISIYPFFSGRKRLLDFLYVYVALFALGFLFSRGYYVARDILAGLDPYSMYQDIRGEKYQGRSILFSYWGRLFLYIFAALYLSWSFKLAKITGRESMLIISAIVVTMLTVVHTT